MVYSSFPTYHDPSNWQQQSITTGFNSNSSQQFIPPYQPFQPQPQPQPQPQSEPQQPPPGSGSSVRPGSMAERARLANIPMPEAALKCPRCESTNTKFCYFNNYSLSQPRHFCKTCRRYWTRGGALRSVPVGGGFRRNKRTKSGGGGSSSSTTSSKSQDSTATANRPFSYSTGLITGHDQILGLGSSLPPLKLMAPLDPHHDFINTDSFTYQYGAVSGSSSHHHHPDLTAFQIGSGSGGGASGLLSGLEQWRFPATQLPLLGGLEISSPSVSSGLYPFYHQSMDPGYGGTGSDHFRAKNNIFHNISSSSSSSPAAAAAAMVTEAVSQLASVKVEDNNNNNQNHQLNLTRQVFGNTEQLWNVSAAITSSWNDVSNFTSSSTRMKPN